jgi:hypothetical protein
MKKGILFLLPVLLLFAADLMFAQVPPTLSYQGMLTGSDDNPVEDGIYEMHFNLYGEADPSTPLWSESQSVTLVKGVFNVILGTVNPLDFPFDEQYYLGIAIGNEEELSPRIALTSSAYSFRARSVDDGQVVKSINELRDDIMLEAGENVSITEDDNKIIISAANTGGGGSVTQITAGEGLTGGGTEGNVTIAIEDEGITTEKLADGAVTKAKLAADALNDGSWVVEDNDMMSGVSGFVGIGRMNRITQEEVFGVRSQAADDELGGMFIETQAITGRPFYGYAVDGSSVAWHEFNNTVNQWQLYLEDIARVVVDRTTGNIGVGTVEPSARLHVHDGNIKITNEFPSLILEGTNVNKTISFRSNNQSQGAIFYNNTGGLKAYVNGDASNNTWVLANNGRFGLGVNSPVEKLDVAGAIRLGTTGDDNAGTIRWTGEDFEGRLEDQWVSLTESNTGNTHTVSSGWQSFNLQNWSEATSFFGHIRRTYEIEVPEITQEILDKGDVQVYVSFAGTSGYKQPLPILQAILLTKLQRLSYHLRLGKIVLEFLNVTESTDPGRIGGTGNQFRYIILSGD